MGALNLRSSHDYQELLRFYHLTGESAARQAQHRPDILR